MLFELIIDAKLWIQEGLSHEFYHRLTKLIIQLFG